jgi:predicted SAM-dependent methyltransferase
MLADLLNLGCGPYPVQPGTMVAGVVCETVWNCDWTAFPGVQLVCDVRTLDLPVGSFKVIRAHEFLEHFEQYDGKRILANCYNWLSADGVVEIKVPDVQSLAEFFVDPAAPDTDADFIGRLYAHGDHKWGFTASTLRELLERVGFKNVTVERRLTVRDMVAVGWK